MINIQSNKEKTAIDFDKEDFGILYQILISLPDQINNVTWDDFSGNPDLNGETVAGFVGRFVNAHREALDKRLGKPQP